MADEWKVPSSWRQLAGVETSIAGCRLTLGSQVHEEAWDPWSPETCPWRCDRVPKVPCGLMRQGPLVSGDHGTELVMGAGLDGSLVFLMPRCRWSRKPRDRGTAGAWDVGKSVSIQQVSGASWDRDGWVPRQLGTQGPWRRGNDSTRDHGQSDNTWWVRGLEPAAALSRVAGKGGARAKRRGDQCQRGRGQEHDGDQPRGGDGGARPSRAADRCRPLRECRAGVLRPGSPGRRAGRRAAGRAAARGGGGAVGRIRGWTWCPPATG